MLIYAQVHSCDHTGTTYDAPVAGGAYLCRGASGRWCQVLHIGPKALAEAVALGTQALTRDEAIEAINSLPGINTVDF